MRARSISDKNRLFLELYFLETMMPNLEEYDLVVLGSGEAGKYIAWTMATQGQRVAVVERRYVGGSCPNIACLPSKNIIHSAKVASLIQRGGEYGVRSEEWTVDMSAVRDRKRAMVDGLVEMHRGKYEASGAELVMGHGQFTGPRMIEVTLNDGGKRTLRGTNVVISTGSRARIASIPGLQESVPLTHVEALELDRVPQHLILIGGGYIGLELAQAFRRFGSRVTIVERNDTLIHREDADVTDAITELFTDEEIEISTGTIVEGVVGTSGKGVRLECRRNGENLAIEGTDLLVAAGRTPNTDGIGLEAAGVELDNRGHVLVNERLQTTAEGVWAVGDCAGSPYFTHIAFDDFRVVRDNLTGIPHVTTGRLVPFCLFTDPELARVGLSEKEAQQRGIRYQKFKIPMVAVLRTRTLSETRGFVKAIVEADSDRVLGFTAFGAGAGELMAVVQVAMAAGLPYTALRDAILTHPTIAEGLVALFTSTPTKESWIEPEISMNDHQSQSG
jgi:pyruvate/2-oxoglutarate dehydrogenase complex dihydrolipoamide dehydrogenase (E3) component